MPSMKAERCQTLPGSGFSGREGAGCEPRPQEASQVEEGPAQQRGPGHGHFGAGQWLRIGGREAAGRRGKSLLSFNSLDIPPALSPQNEARGGFGEHGSRGSSDVCVWAGGSPFYSPGPPLRPAVLWDRDWAQEVPCVCTHRDFQSSLPAEPSRFLRMLAELPS